MIRKEEHDHETEALVVPVFDTIAVLAAIGMLIVAASAPRAPAATMTPKPPIKIGMISHLTGVYGAAGGDEADGAKVALDEVGLEIAGRKIELVLEDDGAMPAVTVTKARKLVELNKVNAMAGIVWSPSGTGHSGLRITLMPRRCSSYLRAQRCGSSPRSDTAPTSFWSPLPAVKQCDPSGSTPLRSGL